MMFTVSHDTPMVADHELTVVAIMATNMMRTLALTKKQRKRIAKEALRLFLAVRTEAIEHNIVQLRILHEREQAEQEAPEQDADEPRFAIAPFNIRTGGLH